MYAILRLFNLQFWYQFHIQLHHRHRNQVQPKSPSLLLSRLFVHSRSEPLLRHPRAIRHVRPESLQFPQCSRGYFIHMGNDCGGCCSCVLLSQDVQEVLGCEFGFCGRGDGCSQLLESDQPCHRDGSWVQNLRRIRIRSSRYRICNRLVQVFWFSKYQ